ncbi:MAG: hypothetical protein KGJ02_06750 [Verrucomicrobiota bacterium]|nr:hypothetical protein [Verrucomicrobiota bacterium]
MTTPAVNSDAISRLVQLSTRPEDTRSPSPGTLLTKLFEDSTTPIKVLIEAKQRADAAKLQPSMAVWRVTTVAVTPSKDGDRMMPPSVEKELSTPNQDEPTNCADQS